MRPPGSPRGEITDSQELVAAFVECVSRAADFRRFGLGSAASCCKTLGWHARIGLGARTDRVWGHARIGLRARTDRVAGTHGLGTLRALLD